MPPFQSRLFNWVYHSLPFQWGRRARQFVQQWSTKVPQQVQTFWEKTIKPLYSLLSPSSDPPSTSFSQKSTTPLPPWQRALKLRISSKLATPPTDLKQRSSSAETSDLVPYAATDRIRHLLEAALSYFIKRPKLSKKQVQEELQTLEEDQGPWPVPPEFINPYIDTPPLPSSSTEGEITIADRESDVSYWVTEEAEERPFYAWIDTHATSLGYAYGPLMNFLYRLDRWIARLETWLGKLWKRIKRWLRL